MSKLETPPAGSLADRQDIQRVALVHSFYRSEAPSGENKVVIRQAEALEKAGYTVELVSLSTDDARRRASYPIRAASTVATGWGPSPEAKLKAFSPDVVHVHNLFPNYGTRWLSRWDGAVVATLHNYRAVCMAGTLFRAGEACTACLEQHSSTPGLLHACYRDSHLASAAMVPHVRFNSSPVILRADLLTVLTDTMLNIHQRSGVDENKIRVVPNFVPDSMVGQIGGGGDHWLYVGRLSREKGILELVSNWPSTHELVVVGSGPLLPDVLAAAGPNVQVVGAQSADRVGELMAGALGLVFPSRSYEGLALVCLEALATGTPILAWSPTDAALTTKALRIGNVVEKALPDALASATKEFPAMRQHCREVFDTNFSESVWVRRIGAVYREAAAIYEARLNRE